MTDLSTYDDRMREIVDANQRGDDFREQANSLAAAVALTVEKCAETCEGTFSPYDSKTGCCDAALIKAAAAIRAIAPNITAEADAMLEDATRYRWLVADHDNMADRQKCRELLDRLGVMSYSAACAAIDAARTP